MKFIKLVVLTVLPVLMTACVQMNEPLSPISGLAVKETMNAQIIDPNPPASGPPPMAGTRAVLAADRYNKGEVIQPKEQRISEIGGEGGR